MSFELQVPARDEPLLEKFIAMSSEEVRSLLKSLDEERPTLNLEDLAESIADRLSANRVQIRETLLFLTNLSMARQALGMSVDEFVVELRAAIEARGKHRLIPEDWDSFQSTIRQALSSETLAISARARDVLSDHERIYRYARVLTDLRPVFRTEVEGAPAAMVAVHTLKIEYHQDRKPYNFFVAMDRPDVEKLIELLQRALKKEDSLKALAKERSIVFLEVKP